MPKIPMIPMVRVLINYAAANNVPLKIISYESIRRCFDMYCQHCKKLN